jgi:hypothetical protein
MDLRRALLLRDDEEIIADYRHHWTWCVGPALLALACVIAPFFLLSVAGQWHEYGILVLLGVFGIGVALLARLVRLWRWNVLVITTQRVIDVDQRGAFRRVVTEVPLGRIRDVSYAVAGAMGAIFRYGAVSVEGEGASVRIAFESVGRPATVHRMIADLAAGLHGAGDGTVGNPGKVHELLAAAAELDSTQARAFMLALDRAFRKSVDTDAPRGRGTARSKTTTFRRKPPERTKEVDVSQFAPEQAPEVPEVDDAD